MRLCDYYLRVITVLVLTIVEWFTCLGNKLDISLISNEARTLLELPHDQNSPTRSKKCMNVFLPREFNVELLTIRSTESRPNAALTVSLRNRNVSNELEVTLRAPSGATHTEHKSFLVNQQNTFEFIFPWNSNQPSNIEKVVPSCQQESNKNNPRNNVCGEFISCGTDLLYMDEVLIRRKRQAVTDTVTTLATGNITTTPESKGLSGGALAAAIIVPILVVGLLAVGGYFLYRWLRSRRTEHGVYQPKEMENQGNFMKQPDPQSVIKLPPEERLI